MFAILHSLAMFVIDFFKSPRRLEAENLFLRHQLSIALRRAPPRLRLRGSDRALMVWLTRLWPSLLDAALVVQPETILRWHRAGFTAFWRWKSRRRAGRPKSREQGALHAKRSNQTAGPASRRQQDNRRIVRVAAGGKGKRIRKLEFYESDQRTRAALPPLTGPPVLRYLTRHVDTAHASRLHRAVPANDGPTPAVGTSLAS